MKSIDERFAEAHDQRLQQTTEWERAAASLRGLGEVPLSVPVETLAALDAVVQRVHAAAGGVQV